MTKLNRLSCEETFRRLDDYLDRMLSPDETRRVEEHLRECAECAAEFEFEGTLLEQLRQKVRRIQLPEDVARRIASRVFPNDEGPGPADPL